MSDAASQSQQDAETDDALRVASNDAKSGTVVNEQNNKRGSKPFQLFSQNSFDATKMVALTDQTPGVLRLLCFVKSAS